MNKKGLNRRGFIKSGILGLAGTAAGSAFLKSGPRVPCSDCRSSSLFCPNGFDVAGKVQDIIRLRAVPREFLA